MQFEGSSPCASAGLLRRAHLFRWVGFPPFCCPHARGVVLSRRFLERARSWRSPVGVSRWE
eukprot:12395444-Alexandrium_andersonii.AAC.1